MSSAPARPNAVQMDKYVAGEPGVSPANIRVDSVRFRHEKDWVHQFHHIPPSRGGADTLWSADVSGRGSIPQPILHRAVEPPALAAGAGGSYTLPDTSNLTVCCSGVACK
jgi:hypothetical protein